MATTAPATPRYIEAALDEPKRIVAASIHNYAQPTRRAFNKLRAPLLILTALVFSACLARAAEIQLVVDKPLPAVAQNALTEFQRALAAHGDTGKVVDTPNAGDALTVFVGFAGHSPAVDQALAGKTLTLPEASESLAVRRDGQSLLICARDARGLSYALREVARSVELTSKQKNPWSAVVEEVAAPALATRNVSIHLFNADVERRWYFDEGFWRSYFGMLALHRFNQFTLTFSDQTNYLCPVYAFLLDMPEYPGVRVEEKIKKERGQQLAMLRRIAELAEAHGIDFNLGIWMQAPVPKYSGAVEVSGLPGGEALAGYAALGLRRLLEACPSIRGVQLRMNEEAGVAAEQQAAFFKPIFQSMRDAGRPVRLELRYKGLQPTTTQAALDATLDVTVSTKFWSEHFGLPYHPTAVDSHWRKDRYSFGTLLQKPQKTKIVYQLWNVGSQRLTTWGSPEYARRFAESCLLGGGSGFEVFAPLTDQGYGNKPGEWRAIKDPKDRVGQWDQERYWYFYLCFGRMGFNRETKPEVWQREFRARFGKSAPSIEKACHAASEILPMITAACLPGASEWSWWPEMDTGGSLREYMHIQPSDPEQFYAISQWKRTPGWRWEEWDEKPGYVEDTVAGRVSGKWTPWDVAERLSRSANDIDMAWRAADQTWDYTPERKVLEMDQRALGALARYHAAKTRAAIQMAFYEVDHQPARVAAAVTEADTALWAWKRLVAFTEVYHDDLIFGVAKDSPRSKQGHSHTGHWRDRLPEVEADLVALRELKTKLEAAGPVPELRRLPLEWGRYRGDTRVQGDIAVKWQPDGGAVVRLEVKPDEWLKRVVLHYRPLDQTRDWQTLEMHSTDRRVYNAAVPAEQIDPRFDWQCYVELLGEARGVCWPSWEERQPYTVFHLPAR